jgi:hypothetical protein
MTMSRSQIGIELATFHQMLIFKAGIVFVLRSPPENQFHDGMDSHKDSIPGNRCQGSFSKLMYRVGNLSPAMGARNQVGIWLSYRPASLCSLATQFQT